jgi:replicative DNA helicase
MAARVPPQNLEAEQSILGSLMLEQDVFDQVADQLEAADFYKPAHQKIYQTIVDLQRKNSPIDLITVSNALQAKDEVEMAGGAEYLVEIVNRTISSANVSSYAKIVKEKALLRKMIQTNAQLIERAYTEDYHDVDTFLSQAEAEFYKLSNNSKSADGLVGAMEIVKSSVIKIEELYKRRAEITGLSTGFTHLDRMTSGLQPGEMIIIAARPSMGKTAFSLNIAQHMALRQNKTVAYFSLEMARDAMMMRILASESRINMKDIRSGKVPDNFWPKLINVAGQISDSKLYIDETPGISPYEVLSRARRLKSQVGLDCIIVDYLQMMTLKQKVESRVIEVAEISRTLKALAKELKIPVIALAQLNRAVESRTERRPMLSDLRESGSIEQDADVIMMLYRDDYYDRESPEKQGLAEVIIAKQRNGPVGTVKLRFDAEYGLFKDADPEIHHPLPPQPPAGASVGGAPTPQKPKNFAPV